MNVFVTGTASKTGKTFVSAALASIMQSLSYKTAVYKPIQLGAYEQNSFMIAPDISYVKKIDPYLTAECTYHLKSTMPPVIAAELEQIKINPKVISKEYTMFNNKYDTVIVEGTGGILTPIAQRFTIANLIKMLNLPIVIITNPTEESVNDTILTANHAEAMGIKINGIILNRYPEGSEDMKIKSLPRLFEEYTKTTVIGIIKELDGYDETTPGSIIDNVLNGVDIEKVFDVKIPKLDV
ncbi:dethiobiotin synthase [bacterium]|nr:dethiobiotin synthase [bacterium]